MPPKTVFLAERSAHPPTPPIIRPLRLTDVMPGIVRKRRVSVVPSDPMAPVVTEPIVNEEQSLALFEGLVAILGSPEATVLTMMRRYRIHQNVLNSLSAKKLKVSFSNAKYEHIAPVFGLDYNDRTLSGFGELEIFRSWLPGNVVEKICRDVDIADVQYGELVTHGNEEARSRYIATLFNRIIYLFRRKITNLPEELMEGGVTTRGRIEHQFVVFGAVAVVFIVVKKELLSGQHRLDQVAQVMAEADACDFRNAGQRLWVPILGILCDGEKMEFFVYNSSKDKDHFRISRRLPGLLQDGSNLRFLASIKKTAELFYDLFLAGYINGLRAYLDRSERDSASSGSKHESTGQWQASLKHAETALGLARHASVLAQGGFLQQAEKAANEAIGCVKKSVEVAPPRPKYLPSIMENWNLAEVVRASLME